MNIVARLLGDGGRARDPGLVAIDTGRGRISYRALESDVGRAARALRERGIGRGDTVVVIGADTPEVVVAFLASLAVGAIGVMISRRFGAAELAVVDAENRPALVVFDHTTEGLSHADPGLAARPHVDATVLLHAGSPGPLDIANLGPADAALRTYSSGTTGQVKGITHGHNDFSTALGYHREVLGIGPGRRVLCTSKLPFAYALVNGLLAPLGLGATLCLHPQWLDAAAATRVIARFEPDVVFSTPSLYRGLLDGPGPAAAAALAQVEHYCSAGEHLPAALVERWRELTHRTIHDCYGCSEAPFFILATPAGGAPAGSSGRPAPGARVRLVDAEGGEVGAGETGHLWIRHEFMASGYPAHPEAWAQRCHGEWFDTGDLFQVDERGNWFHRGREDSLTKVAGQWVSLAEIEELAATADGIAEAAAALHADKDGMQRVGLVVVPAGDAPAQVVATLRERLERELPRRKQPRWIVTADALPRTHTGKVQRFRLRQLLDAGVDD